MTIDGASGFEDLAMHAAEKLVDAMATDTWSLVSAKIKSVIGLEQRMDLDHERLEHSASDGDDREMLRSAWQARIEGVLDANRDRAVQLRAVLDELGPVAQRSSNSQRIGRVDRGGKAVQISGHHN